MVKDFFGEDYGLMDHRTFGSGPFPGCDENLYKNLDHTRIIQVEEYTTYHREENSSKTFVTSEVKFSSGFNWV